MILQVFKVDLLHERLKPPVCQNGFVNSRKNFLCRNLLWTKSFCAAQRRFRWKFQCRHYPDKRSVHRWAQKFREHRTALNLNAKDKRVTYSGRPKSARSQENIDGIRDSVVRSPRKSLRCHSQELGINRESIRRILVKDLQLYPYRIQIKHKLTQADMEKRVAMCAGSVTRLMRTLISWTICGSRMKHISSSQAMWTQKTTSSGAQLLQKIVYNGHDIPLNEQPGLPYRNMESLGHTGSRTIVNSHSWLTLNATLKCYRVLDNIGTTKRL